MLSTEDEFNTTQVMLDDNLDIIVDLNIYPKLEGFILDEPVKKLF